MTRAAEIPATSLPRATAGATASDAAPAGAAAGALKAAPGVRILAGGVAAGCLGVLGLASWLTPAAAGHGTHGQLGLPPCGWVLAMGRPCPSCGMTTAFAHAADGELARAAWAQPAGLLLAVLAAAGVWAAAEVALLGSNLSPLGAKLVGGRLLLAAGAVLLAAWIFKLATWGG